MGEVAQGVSEIFGGFNQKERMKEQAMAAEFQAGVNRLQGKQVGASVREDLNSTLASIKVLRSNRGLSSGSATAKAIRDKQRKDSRYAENNAVLGHKFQEMANLNKATGLRAGAKWAATSGLIKGFGSIMQGAADNAGKAMTGGGGK